MKITWAQIRIRVNKVPGTDDIRDDIARQVAVFMAKCGLADERSLDEGHLADQFSRCLVETIALACRNGLQEPEPETLIALLAKDDISRRLELGGSEYMAWVKDVCSRARKAAMQRRRSGRGSLNGILAVHFIEEDIYYRKMAMVLFKENQPLHFQDLSRCDLSTMGWHTDERGQYWKYQLYAYEGVEILV